MFTIFFFSICTLLRKNCTALLLYTNQNRYPWCIAFASLDTLSKWFEPRSISSSCSVIVRVSVVLKRTVGDSD